ncbi:MAG: efflux RND transporter periplasmic adaptor subunit [Hyphomicrobiales bacterium]|nr:efflux RND transporter periplasmic adaptor subunit [Hyphomicrobiales bacterium]
MAFKIKGSHIVAIVIAAGVSGWMYTGSSVVGGQPPKEGVTPIVKREAERSSKLFRVRYVSINPEPWLDKLTVHGQTKASAVVSVRAQVSGILINRLVNKGDHVSKNQIVCKIDPGARTALLAKFQARLAKVEADHTANSTLVEKGIVSKNLLKTMKASLDAAKAEIKEARLKLERSDIRANASGIVQDPVAEVGDMLSIGSPCVTLVQSDPIKFTGQISERDIAIVRVGASASIELISGKVVSGVVRYISPSADTNTRTFLTEIEIPNTNGRIRVGMTARAKIKLPTIDAYRISPSWITLSDDGKVGVRTIDENSIVDFAPIKIVDQTKNAFWVQGLQPGSKIISLGQEYVIAGEKVEAVVETVNSEGIKQ